ncbi:26951_t:CDS:2, partial [Racocetra persica]
YYQTDSSTSLSSEISVNVFAQMMSNATNLNHLPTFTITEHSTILEKLRYDIVEWIYENNSGWSNDTAIMTGKEFVKDLASALWYIDKCDPEKLKNRGCSISTEIEQFTGLNIFHSFFSSAWIKRSAFHWLINPLEKLATNLSRYQKNLQKQLITTTQNYLSFELVNKNNSFLTILQPNLIRKSHIINHYQTLVNFLEKSNYWESINIESFLPNESFINRPKHRYIKELNKGLPFKVAQFIHDSKHGSSVIYLWHIPLNASDSE